MESVEEICDYVGMINLSTKVLEGSVVEVRNSFKTNTYEVLFKGDVSTIGIEPVNVGVPDALGYAELQFKIEEEQSKALIDQLNKNGEISVFKQSLPSIKDIFIQKVEEGKHG
jgi:ABC-2 type transport system ATP-binding protein